ncbi:50S ribosomal protein L11 methyltransferase [Nitrospira sp. Kam-Ns4a]
MASRGGSDDARLIAFRRAINEVVKPDDVVLDLGAGTGILGLLACQAGAGRVYAVEEGGMIQLVREICRANGFQDRLVPVKGLSTRVDLPEPVDVVVADQIGRFGFEAGVFEYFADARERFLKPGGQTIPRRIDLQVVPVECPHLWEQVEFWNHPVAGFDFSAARPLAANTGYPVKYRPEHLLGKPAVIASLDPATAAPAILGLEVSIPVARRGLLNGIGGWFAAQLSEHVTLSNSPLADTPIDRHGVFFPLDRPVELMEGDRVRVRMDIRPADTLVTWNVTVPGKVHEAHSTFQGMLLCEEDLRKTKPSFVPRLTPWGEARLSVLILCDGRRTLAEVEQEVYKRHPTLFRSAAEAAKFVAEVVAPYAV